MRELKSRDYEIIERNLTAFENNFKSIVILENKGIYYVYREGEETDLDNYIYWADSIEEIKGWLDGAIKAIRGVVKTL